MDKLIAGDSSPIWEVGFEQEDGTLATLDGNFTCRIAVVGTAIDRAVTAKTVDNKRFRAWLTPAETLLMTSVITVGVQISNATLSPPLVLEYQAKLQMKAGVVPNS